MSGTTEDTLNVGRFMPDTLPMAFQSFAAMIGVQPVRDTQGRIVSVSAGSPQEIWLKYLKAQHGNEKHTYKEWQDLIVKYSMEPAHPDGMTP